MLPHYIFFPDGQFITVITHQEKHEITLIQPFATGQRVTVSGDFATSIFSMLKKENQVDKTQLCLIEKQHPWLKGLSEASLTPPDVSQIIIGDELGLLFLEITDQCNEQCIHCYASSSPACSDFLSLDEIKSILEQARALGRPFVQFTGGDPLIHHDLVAAVAFTDALDVQGIEIYTNGLLLSETLLEKLLPYQPVIAFSLYSPDEAVHDGITQVKGSFKKTVAAIHRAQDMALKVRIGMAVMEQNAGHEQAMLDFAKAEFYLDKSSVRFDPVHETGRGSKLNTKHISLMPSQNSHMSGVPSAKKHHQVVQQDGVKKVLTNTAVPLVRHGKLAVCANGNISPCIFNREHVLGNIRQQTLNQALTQPSSDGNLVPSVARWNACQHNLSCSDCHMVAYTLGSQT